MPLTGAWRRGARATCFGAVAALVAGSAFAGQHAPSMPRVTFAAPASAPAALPRQPAGQPRVRWDLDERPTLVIGPVRLAPRAVVRGEMRRSDAPLDRETESRIDLAKRRVGVEGSVGDYADFQIEYEIDDTDPWRDVFVNVSPIQQIQVQYGKFKLPFGLEENTGSANLDFAYRSLMSRVLAPGRDRGIMVHGELLDQFVEYEIGQFEHDGANAATRSAEKVTGEETRAYRITGSPLRRLRDEIDDMTIGLSWTESDLSGEGLSSVAAQTTMSEDFWESEWAVVGKRTRRGIEARWRPGPFSVSFEHMRLSEERLGLSVEDTDLAPIVATGWYASGTWAITGDEKEEGLVATENPIGRGIGAIEIAARVERLRIESGSGEPPSSSPRAEVIIGNQIRAITFGVNWYLNRWLKLHANVVRETIDDPAQGPLPAQPSFWSRVVRIQFSL